MLEWLFGEPRREVISDTQAKLNFQVMKMQVESNLATERYERERKEREENEARRKLEDEQWALEQKAKPLWRCRVYLLGESKPRATKPFQPFMRPGMIPGFGNTYTQHYTSQGRAEEYAYNVANGKWVYREGKEYFPVHMISKVEAVEIPEMLPKEVRHLSVFDNPWDIDNN